MKVSNISFEFKNKEKPENLACNISSSMHNYPYEDILKYNYSYSEFKPELIK